MKILHQWNDAKGDPFVIREGDGEPLLSADGKNAVPARNWRWPTEPLVREISRLAAENAELKAEPDFVALVARAVRDEGDRIRRELLAEFDGAEPIKKRHFVGVLKRIVPGEG